MFRKTLENFINSDALFRLNSKLKTKRMSSKIQKKWLNEENRGAWRQLLTRLRANATLVERVFSLINDLFHWIKFPSTTYCIVFVSKWIELNMEKKNYGIISTHGNHIEILTKRSFNPRLIRFNTIDTIIYTYKCVGAFTRTVQLIILSCTLL